MGGDNVFIVRLKIAPSDTKQIRLGLGITTNKNHSRVLTICCYNFI